MTTTATAETLARPAPGRYPAQLRGRRTTPLGDQELNESATVDVEHVGDVGMRTLTTSSDSTQEQRVVLRADGAYLSSLRLTSPAFDVAFEATEPVLALPAAASRGWSWRLRSTDGGTTASFTASDAGSSTVTLGGQNQPCRLTKARLQLTGDVQVDIDLSTCYLRRTLLALRSESTSNGTYQGFDYSSNQTTTLSSASPS